MSQLATVQDINNLKKQVKLLLTPLNKLTCDEALVEKYIKEQAERKSEEKKKKERENYKFTASEYADFLSNLIHEECLQEILDIDVDDEVWRYDYTNFLAEHHRDKLEEIMKILIECHDKIGLILLPLVQMKNEQKKKGSFEVRRAKFA